MIDFYMVEKKGTKWVAVAKIGYPDGSTTCIARALGDLIDRGHGNAMSRVVWAVVIAEQKNFGGEIADIPSYIGVGG